MVRRSVKILASLGIAVVALGACGGDDDNADAVDDAIKEAVENGNIDTLPGNVGGDPADLPDPCELVTTEDAAGLFGVDAQEEDDSSPVDLGASCLYGNVGGEDVGTVSHLLQVRVFDGEQFFGAETFDDEQAVDGLGDDAFVRAGAGGLGGVEVQFVQDGETVSINYSTVNIGVDDADKVEASDHQDEVVALAQQASTRL
jgi:hypothetical protein